MRCHTGMKKNLLMLAGAAAMALGLGACAYDPYYSGNTRTAVNVGYGYGHGYGGSSFSTSYFWNTGSTRWGYDPYVRCYYDHSRRAYYDPYLYGYYPVGYRPRALYGVPHPSGYRQGWCPPPRRITNVTVSNYRNRESAYRKSNYDWSRNVRYNRTQRAAPAPPTRSRNDAGTRGRSTSPFAGFINSGGNRGQQGIRSGSSTRTVRPTPGSTWQPRTAPVQPRTTNSRPTTTRPNFSPSPGNRRATPDMNRGGGRAQPAPRQAPTRRVAPAPRQNAQPQGRRAAPQNNGRSDNSQRARSR